jgi:exopolysaccharide biosynthesis polyprenyl glycosylphosphotransferase
MARMASTYPETQEAGGWLAAHPEAGIHLTEEPDSGKLSRAATLLGERPWAAPRRRRVVGAVLAFADVVAIAVAFLAVELVFGGDGGLSGAGTTAETVVLGLIPGAAWFVVASAANLYGRDDATISHTTFDETGSVLHLAGTSVGAGVLAAWLAQIHDVNIGRAAILWVVLSAAILGLRGLARMAYRRHPLYPQRTIVVGAGDVGQLLAHKFFTRPEFGIDVVGFVDSQPRERRDDLGDMALIGSLQDLPATVARLRVERVIIAFSRERQEDLIDVIRMLDRSQVRIDVVPRLYEVASMTLAVHPVDGIPLVTLPVPRLSRRARFFKRAMDIVLAGIGLIVLLPVLVLIAVLIKLESDGPALFTQLRVCSDNEVFRISKFRTMVADADDRKGEVAHLNKHLRNGGDPRMFKIPSDPRITRLGAVLRRYSLDELPQLINVLRGEMTLVGPRPLILDEDCLVPDWARHRLDLKPGITGPWQVMGSSQIPFEEMVRLDFDYISTWSFWRDVVLILKTLPVLTGRREFA